MPQAQPLISLTMAALAMLAQVFALTGYTPPLPLDKLLHASPQQVANVLGLLTLFLAPVHKSSWAALEVVASFVNAKNGRSDADFSKLQADFAQIAKQVASMRSGQSGRASTGLLGVLAAGLLVVVMSGCSTVTADKAAQAKAIFTNACANLTTTATTLKALPLSEDGKKSLSVVDTVLTQACSASAAVSVASVRDLANSALAPLQSIVNSSSLDDEKKASLVIYLGVANALLNQAITMIDTAQAAASAASSASE